MNGPSPEMVELFLQEASEHLQFLREYSGILQDPYPLYEDIERLYISAHGVAGTGGTYGYSLFHEVAGKLAHIFQYAMNATISPEATAPLVEFIYEAIAVLESDLIMVSAQGVESVDDIAAFKLRYPFAFQGPPPLAIDAPTEQPHPPEPEAPASVTPPIRPVMPPRAPVSQRPVARPTPPISPETTPPHTAAPTQTVPPVAVPQPAAPILATTASVPPTVVEPVVEPPVFVAAPSVSEPPTVPTPAPIERVEEPLAEPLTEIEPLAAAPVEPASETLDEPLYEVEPFSPAASDAAFEHAAEPLDEPPAPLEPVAPSTVADVAAASEPAAAHATTQPIAPLPSIPQSTPVEALKISIANIPELEPDEELPAEVLEFFVPEVEEHLQTVTDCLLALEANSNPEDINRLFRAMHTIKGSAAQVGAQRIATIAHRAEDLVGRLRDGELKPSATIVDLCLETVDVLKKTIYRQWEDDTSFQIAARTLMAKLERAAPTATERGVEAAAVAETEAPSADAIPSTEAASTVAPASQAEPFAEPAAPTAVVETAPTTIPLAAAPPAAPFEPPPAPTPTQIAAPELQPVSAEMASLAAEFALQHKDGELSAGPQIGSPEMVAAHTPVGMAQSKSVRIALERLDRMMNAVGELVINRTRMLGRLAELEKLAEVLNFSKGRMSDKVTEFQDKYEFSRINSAPMLQAAQWPGSGLEMRADSYGGGESGGSYFGNTSLGAPGFAVPYGTGASEFSELEMDRYDDFGILSRSLTEISADISEVLTQLDGFVRRVDGDIDEFTKLAHRLQDEITQARMVPIGNLYTRIARTVRDAAKASNKKVELTLAGAETELDNNIIQHLADPLLHLVRNAVAHGIERDEERYEAGKPDQGNIAVRAYHKGNHIYVEVEDDGRGVDFERVKATAIESGLITAEQAPTLGRRELVNLLFRPGFSTAPRRTELAGRGVGLDVVRSNVDSLNGEIEVETEKGIGSRFTLKVPLTLIISQALFVQCGEQTFAFPLGFVEEIRRIRLNEIEEVGGKLITKVRDVLTEVVRFDEALQLPRLQPVNGYLRLVLVNVGGRQVGVVVEEVLRKDEIVIKNLGEYLRNVKLFPGATIAPDGGLILLVDINRLIMGESIERRPLTTAMNAARLFLPGATAVARGEIPAAAVDRVEQEKLVVLADDSISVRKFVGRMLEKAGYRVKLACDGLEALEIASSSPCDLVITDLEMPRTNGYELMLHLRQTPSTSKVPVMVVTSRAGAKHRERALKEGAKAFMVKPVQEDLFIAQVVELIGTSGQATAVTPVVQ
jgi:chemosensory pili system protein ChpA (sensor histidine kinase/response regulator)